MIVWEKTNPMPVNGRYVFLSGVECAVHFRKKWATFICGDINPDYAVMAIQRLREGS